MVNFNLLTQCLMALGGQNNSESEIDGHARHRWQKKHRDCI